MQQLPHTFRTSQVLETMQTKIEQCRAIGQPVGNQRGGDIRDQHLPAVPARAQPSAADDRQAEVVALVPQLGLAGVNRHPHRERDAITPALGTEQLLRAQAGGDGVRRSAERAHDAVTLALLDGAHSAVCRDGFLENLVMPRHGGRHRVGLA